jgi:D-alanyl-D-alanine carboxypeptidase
MKANPKIVGLATVAAILALLIVLPTSDPLSAGYASNVSTEHSARLEQIVRGLVAGGAPGALVVVRTPRGTQRAASGFANLEPKVPLRTTDRFRVASVTKSFVATVVLQLAAEKRLSLNDSLERWLPGTVDNGRSITLDELLNHTSGLFDYDEDQAWVSARFSDPGREWSAEELVAIATSHPPLFAPGTSWSYSNTNYVLLGLVIEAVTGRTLAGELQTRLFRPLRLGFTSFPTGTVMPGRFAHGYFVSRAPLPEPAGTLIDVSTTLSPSAWGAGQIVSNAEDLTRFFAALIKGRLLRAAQLAKMKTEVTPHRYGLGLRITHTACGKAFGHDGDFPGYRNVVWATADGRHVASVMVNVDPTRVPWSKLEAAAKTALCSG